MLSPKQIDSINLLEHDPNISEVLFGGAAGCFTSETLIKTINGDKPISKINIGDYVLSWNIDKSISEFKQVVNKFAYGCNRQKHKVIIFDYSNQLIKCTYEHEFYYEGDWQPAYRLAQRAMEMGCEYKQQICNKQFRTINDNWIQGLDKTFHNEASIRREGLLSNYVKVYRKNSNDKNSQVSCSGVYTESGEQTYCKSQKWNKNGQFIREFRVGYNAGERIARISERMDKETDLHQFCKRRADWDVKTYRTASKRDKTKVYSESLYKGYASTGIQHKSIDGERYCDKKKLEARSIDLSKIKSICVYEFDGLVYDLTVQDNHNYVLSAGDTIVHNSGKSFLGCFWQIVRRMYNPGTRGFMGRNTYMDFKVTTFKTFWEVWNDIFANNPLNIEIKYNSQDKTVYFSNGSEILIKDLSYNSTDPEFNDLGGMELTDAFIDEVPGITKKAKDVVSSRIRFKLINGKAPLLMTANPTNNWVKTEFISDRYNTPVVLAPHQAYIAAKLTDNPDPAFVEMYRKKLETLPLYDRLRLLEGYWDSTEPVVNPYMYAFNADIHVSHAAVKNENMMDYISMDFNINPLCMIGGHYYREKDLHCIDIHSEYMIQKGSIPVLIDEINANYKTPSKILITGDAGGNVGNIHARDNISMYNQIMKGCNLNARQVLVRNNPRHKNSRADCNTVLQNSRYRVRINPNCINLIRDLQKVQCDSEGSIIKQNRKNIHEQADFLDCFRYFIHNFVPK
jgi:hypothetical protein